MKKGIIVDDQKHAVASITELAEQHGFDIVKTFERISDAAKWLNKDREGHHVFLSLSIENHTGIKFFKQTAAKSGLTIVAPPCHFLDNACIDFGVSRITLNANNQPDTFNGLLSEHANIGQFMRRLLSRFDKERQELLTVQKKAFKTVMLREVAYCHRQSAITEVFLKDATKGKLAVEFDLLAQQFSDFPFVLVHPDYLVHSRFIKEAITIADGTFISLKEPLGRIPGHPDFVGNSTSLTNIQLSN